MANEIEKSNGNRYPAIKAGFDLEANKRNYQLLLQHLAGITITPDNVMDDHTKEAREVLKALSDKKDAEAKEPVQWHRDVLAAHKSLSEPLQEHVNRIQEEKKVVAERQKKERDTQLREQSRIAACQTAIVDFINKVANLIKVAKDDNDIVAIEKMIGSEKTKTSVYQEFIGNLAEQCDTLRPQIKDQKENIRKLIDLQEKEQKAIESGKMHEAVTFREQKEQMEVVIEETGIRIHEKAYEQAVKIDIVAPEVADAIPKGRTNWKWRVDDIKLLQKKMPHLVKLVPDEDAINTLLTTKKLDGSLTGKDQETLFGLVFFNDKKYK